MHGEVLSGMMIRTLIRIIGTASAHILALWLHQCKLSSFLAPLQLLCRTVETPAESCRPSISCMPALKISIHCRLCVPAVHDGFSHGLQLHGPGSHHDAASL